MHPCTTRDGKQILTRHATPRPEPLPTTPSPSPNSSPHTQGRRSNNRLLSMALRQHIGERLVGADKIRLDGDVVLDLEEDDGGGDDERTGEQAPVGRELAHVGDLVAVKRPHHGRAC
jgi:hypothetical protein